MYSSIAGTAGKFGEGLKESKIEYHPTFEQDAHMYSRYAFELHQTNTQHLQHFTIASQRWVAISW